MNQKLSTADYHAWLDSPLTKALKQSHQTEVDALAKNSDRAYELLRWVETEMRYAGWDTRINDQHGRTDVYEAIVGFLK